MSNVIIIKSGFQKINVPDLRQSSDKKGENLFLSNHVKNVEEWKSERTSLIKAQVIRQTSIKQHFDNFVIYYSYNCYLYISFENCIKVILIFQIDVNRNVTDRQCNCPAGLGKNCKHIAAVINFINFESAESKTSQRCQWNVPSVPKNSEEYSKGRKISDLIPKKAHPKEYDPVDLGHLNIICSLSNMLKSARMTESTKTANLIIRELIDSVVDTVCTRNCLNLYHHFYNYHTSLPIYSSNVSFKKILHEIFYDNNIIYSLDQLKYICVNTRGQSECKEWYDERAIRVSASGAHAIKTRRSKFDVLADSMTMEKKMKGKGLKNVLHGKKNEESARELYKKITGYAVEECGLVIHSSQPWLCASPDGVVIVDGTPTKILEIKCPISVQNKPVVNKKGQLTHPYLEFNDNNTVNLQKSHAYYTQCQILMYCTGLLECDFFVYFPNLEYTLITIPRDEVFLSQFIPKFEIFYVNYYIEKLICKYGI